MNKAEVLKLARLSRIEISDEEAEGLTHEFEAILNYVSEVKGATDNRQSTTGGYPTRNVMREDNNPHEAGIYTEDLVSQAPARENNFIKVKKIL